MGACACKQWHLQATADTLQHAARKEVTLMRHSMHRDSVPCGEVELRFWTMNSSEKVHCFTDFLDI